MGTHRHAMDLPAPTRDPTRARADLREHGLCLLLDALEPARRRHVRSLMHDAIEQDHRLGRAQTGFALDADDRNVRIWNLLNRDPVFADLAEDERALTLVRDVLGAPALLSNISGNVTRPGSAVGVLHADQVFVPEPWPARPQGVNVAWCIDDFTRENGATEVVPGSHRLNRSPGAADAGTNCVAVEVPAGSLFAFESRLWHRTGGNTSHHATRAAIFAFYTTPIYRPQENWFLSLDPAVVERASPTLLALLGYRSEGFGLVYGRSPR